VAAYPHRMRDLVRLTGTPAPTIHFHLQQGLLPAARKTAGNQALYSEETVRRVLWIRSLQAELHLPLRSIRWLLEQHGELPITEIRALQALGSLLDEPDPEATAEELAAAEEADPGDLAALRRLGLVGAEGPLSSSDLRLVQITTAFALLVPFVLPGMHERYFYPGEVLAVALAFLRPRRTWFVPLLVQFSSLVAYQNYMFHKENADLRIPALAMFVAIVVIVLDLVWESNALAAADAEPAQAVTPAPPEADLTPAD